MLRYLSQRGVQAAEAVGGVNLSFFRPDHPDPRPIRARTGAPVQVLVYGRLSRPRKGSRIAVRAIESAARSTRIPVELTLFDSLPPGAPGEPLGRPVAVPHRWVFRPSQEELRALYAKADLFVSAERRAGWSNTAAEAMACGAAVVCTRSGTEDFAIDGKTASVCWPWSWAIAKKIAPLLRDPSARVALAAAGRERIGDFPWERTADRIEIALRSRLERNEAAIA
jgi:glycosyltransferase involved in cell wall biosynthesis